MEVAQRQLAGNDRAFIVLRIETMRVAWATPFNEHSAIGRYAYQVSLELKRRGVQVEIIRTEVAESARLPAIASEIPIRGPNVDPETLRADFDLTVVTLADHFPFNGGSVEILKRLPCVGVFHDADLHHLTSGMTHYDVVDQPTLDSLRQIESESAPGLISTGKDLTWIATLCLGAVVHSPHYLIPLQAGCPGPTLLVPLCFDRPCGPSTCTRSDVFTIVTFGYLNPNKQVDRVMRAIAQSAQIKNRFVYRLFGLITDSERDRLFALAQELKINPPQFEGWVSDERLPEILGEANVICCLRHPIVEGGSASLIFALYSSTPVIVADAGSYAQVPDDLVWKVSYGTRVEDVTKALEAIAANQEGADARAAKAAAWAGRTYSVSAYVDKLLPFLHECRSMLPVIDASRMLGAALRDCGASLDEPAAARIGSVLQQLFTETSGGVVGHDNT